MKRLFLLFAAAILVAAPVFAQDKPAPKATSGTASKTMNAAGTVSAVTADSLTVKGKSGEWTFAVDDKTHVSAHGASHKSSAMKDDKKPTQITDFVHVGDTVQVAYHDMGATKHAASVTVKGSNPTPKK